MHVSHHQRLKTGDLRRPLYQLFGSFMVVVLAYSQFPYRTKEQNTSLRKSPLCGQGNNRPLQRNRKGIRFLMSLAKIKSNMNLLVSSNPRFCLEDGRETMMMMMILTHSLTHSLCSPSSLTLGWTLHHHRLLPAHHPTAQA